MLKKALLCAALGAAITTPVAAQQAVRAPAAMPSASAASAQQLLEERLVDYTLVFAQPVEAVVPTPTLLTEISTWIAQNFDLPAFDPPPKIVFATPGQIASIRYRGVLNHQPSAIAGSEIVAVYDDSTQTIYLSEGWRGTTPAEVSILVHEMVHHLQSLAGTKFECPQAREQLAYAAQQRWLGLFGHNLEDDFQLDPFTLLVTTRCMF